MVMIPQEINDLRHTWKRNRDQVLQSFLQYNREGGQAMFEEVMGEWQAKIKATVLADRCSELEAVSRVASNERNDWAFEQVVAAAHDLYLANIDYSKKLAYA